MAEKLEKSSEKLDLPFENFDDRTTNAFEDVDTETKTAFGNIDTKTTAVFEDYDAETTTVSKIIDTETTTVFKDFDDETTTISENVDTENTAGFDDIDFETTTFFSNSEKPRAKSVYNVPVYSQNLNKNTNEDIEYLFDSPDREQSVNKVPEYTQQPNKNSNEDIEYPFDTPDHEVIVKSSVTKPYYTRPTVEHFASVVKGKKEKNRSFTSTIPRTIPTKFHNAPDDDGEFDKKTRFVKSLERDYNGAPEDYILKDFIKGTDEPPDPEPEVYIRPNKPLEDTSKIESEPESKKKYWFDILEKNKKLDKKDTDASEKSNKKYLFVSEKPPTVEALNTDRAVSDKDLLSNIAEPIYKSFYIGNDDIRLDEKTLSVLEKLEAKKFLRIDAKNKDATLAVVHDQTGSFTSDPRGVRIFDQLVTLRPPPSDKKIKKIKKILDIISIQGLPPGKYDEIAAKIVPGLRELRSQTKSSDDNDTIDEVQREQAIIEDMVGITADT